MIQAIPPTNFGTETASTTSGSGSVQPAAAAAAPVAAAGSGAGEEVTLSADASTTTQLLDAARGADGVNQSAVQQLRGAIRAGTYNVSPNALAKAISGALRESPT
jgi:negative regulator of flagellin synthesis FlgM